MILPPVADILIYTQKRKGKSMRSGTTAGRESAGGRLEESCSHFKTLRVSFPLNSALKKKINILILIKRFSDPPL